MADDATEADAEAGSEHVVEEPLLAKVPDGVNTLGAGALFTSTLLTALATAIVAYDVVTGGSMIADLVTANTSIDFQPYQLYLLGFQYFTALVAQASGVYFALNRVRWMWVMLAATLGSLVMFTLPFTVTALVCVGLGKYHFAAYTPSEMIRGE